MKRKFRDELKQFMRGNVLQAREQASLSQEKMAPYLGISSRALSNIEGGQSCCSLYTFLLYCYYFRHNIPSLFENIFDIIENSFDDKHLFFDSDK